ncbi:MAG: hypothetical protein ACLP8S_02605 [Solirubrobacteraceae bacterium]
MFDHNAATPSYGPYADASPTTYGDELEYTPEQTEIIEAEEAEGYLSPSPIEDLELQYETMDSLPPATAETYENDVVSTENQVAEQSAETSIDDAENFDQEVINGDDSNDGGGNDDDDGDGDD